MTLKSIFEKVLNARYTHIEQETASFATERDGTTLYILFEWSNGATDWRNNFDFPAKPYRDMKSLWFAHRGFLRVWKTIEPYLHKAIMDLTVDKIIIAGYSHGAAIALLCHEYCKFNRLDIPVEGYGFGCPRVAWGFLGETVKQRFDGFTVIRNRRDLITCVPPIWLGFRHVGNVKTIGRTNPIKDHFSERYLIELGGSENGYESNV